MRPFYLGAVALAAALLIGCDGPLTPAGPRATPDGAKDGAVDIIAEPSASAVAIPAPGTRTQGSDWSDFLGPGRNNKSPDEGILTDWPGGGPRVVWKKPLGTGYGSCSISEGRLMLFDRHGDVARLTCMNSETGAELWRFEYPTAYRDMLGYNNGPRCTPVIDDRRVYIYGAQGKLHCLSVVDGRLLWMVDTAADYNVMQNFFGVGSTPLVEGDLVIAQVGGSPPGSPPTYTGDAIGDGSGIVAWDKVTGQERYRITDQLAAYASPVAATIAGRRWCFSFSRDGLVGFDPESGNVKFEFPWRSKKLASVNASTPIVIGDQVFISEAYELGSSMLRIQENGVEVVWSDRGRRRDKSMRTHWNTAIYHEGTIYGSSGQHSGEATLRAIDASDGRILWSQPGLLRSSLLFVDGHFVCLSEDGTLRLIRATPERYEEVAAVDLREDGRRLLRYPAWPPPVLAQGLLYVRDERQLVCLDLRARDPNRSAVD